MGRTELTAEECAVFSEVLMGEGAFIGNTVWTNIKREENAVYIVAANTGAEERTVSVPADAAAVTAFYGTQHQKLIYEAGCLHILIRPGEVVTCKLAHDYRPGLYSDGVIWQSVPTESAVPAGLDGDGTVLYAVRKTDAHSQELVSFSYILPTTLPPNTYLHVMYWQGIKPAAKSFALYAEEE